MVAATMLALLPFHKPLAFLDGRLAKNILLPRRPPDMDNGAAPSRFRPSSPVESHLPRDREDPCLFRTRLFDSVADAEADIAFGSTDKLDADDIRFDDARCISVGRSTGKVLTTPGAPVVSDCESQQISQGRVTKELDPRTNATPANMIIAREDEQLVPATPPSVDIDRTIPPPAEEHQFRPTIHTPPDGPATVYRTVLVDHDNNANNGEEDEDSMETMNMPFWNLPKRQKLHPRHTGDTIPDDMSIISDISLIPTYFPSDITKQQRPRHRALFKRIIRTKARAARQTMRELKRSCRVAVENAFVEPATHKTPKCVAVGSVY